jgi:intracellular multiplication protein IcmV
MAIRDIFKISRKTFFNPSGWTDWNYLKFQNKTVVDIIKTSATPEKPVREETFEQAMQRLGLTEADVQTGAASYRLYAVIFFLIGVALFAYAFYLLFSHTSILGFVLGLATTGLCVVQAFKFDFWSFQMRRRQLGATFAEWQRSILGDKRPSK